MVLDIRDVLQVNATVITGILILLTITSFTGKQQNGSNTFFDQFIIISTIVIMIPFSISALLSLQNSVKQIMVEGTYEKDIYYYKSQFDKDTNSLTELIKLVNGDKDVFTDQQKLDYQRLTKQIQRHEKSLQKMTRSKYGLVSGRPSNTSIVSMWIGFLLLTVLMAVAAIIKIS